MPPAAEREEAEAVLSAANVGSACMAPSSREGCFQGHVFGLTGELRRRDLEATLKSNGAQVEKPVAQTGIPSRQPM